jgi:uncharacterized protein YndB with AHSA1/START domain
VTRSVDIAADRDDVWSAIADPERRADWLDDPDAGARTLCVEEAEAGHRLVWTWWRPDEPDASRVEIALRPLDGGGTRVVVTETLALPLPTMSASASLTASAVGAVAGSAGPRVRARLCWDRRLLGLELQFIGVLAGVR